MLQFSFTDWGQARAACPCPSFFPLPLDFGEAHLSSEAEGHGWAETHLEHFPNQNHLPLREVLAPGSFLTQAECQGPGAPVFLQLSLLTMSLLASSACTDPGITPEPPLRDEPLMKTEQKLETMRGNSSQDSCSAVPMGGQAAADPFHAICCSFSMRVQKMVISPGAWRPAGDQNWKVMGQHTVRLGVALATVSIPARLSICESAAMPLLEKGLGFVTHLGALTCFSQSNWPKVTEEICSRTGK